jgi:hypothetical protein
MQQRQRTPPPGDDAVVRNMDSWHERACYAQRRLLSSIAEADRRELWRDEGAHDMAHWLWMRYGISDWKARRWIAAAHALDSLSRIAEAFTAGSIGIDKVVELCRFATPVTEEDLLPWAERVSAGVIRARGDQEARRSLEDVQKTERARSLRWWHEDEGRAWRLEATLPSAQGSVVAKAIERIVEQLPVIPGEDPAPCADERRADALVALASARIASDPDPDRATIVVHVPLETLARERSEASSEPGCALEGDGVVQPETARRLACTARLETVIENGEGRIVGLGRTFREPSAQMLRALRHRDHGCTFPGCGSRRFTHAHHIVWWAGGGRTDLDNLLLLCSFHHKLVHELGWRLARHTDGRVRWYRPDGRRYRAGPSPPTLAAAGL